MLTYCHFDCGHAGAVYKYDLSLPPNDMYKLVEEMRARMKHLPVTVVGYGHMGDSNLHLNISAGKDHLPCHQQDFGALQIKHLPLLTHPFVRRITLHLLEFASWEYCCAAGNKLACLQNVFQKAPKLCQICK